jgi:5-methylcytosine-specific restriction endonuclease McrA
MTNDERKARNREKTARYRARHRERVLAQGRAQSKKHYAAHRDKAIAAMRADYQKHRAARRAQVKAKRLLLDREQYLFQRKAEWTRQKEKRNASRRLKRAANPEAARRKQTEWRTANLDAVRRKKAQWRSSPEQRAKAVARTAKWMREHPEHARALARKQDAKRRAIEREVFVEAVDPRVVFDRDQGMCGICSEPVDPMSQWEIDHVIPILRGGLHAYANVQLAHRRCNRSKGAKCG